MSTSGANPNLPTSGFATILLEMGCKELVDEIKEKYDIKNADSNLTQEQFVAILMGVATNMNAEQMSVFENSEFNKKFLNGGGRKELIKQLASIMPEMEFYPKGCVKLGSWDDGAHFTDEAKALLYPDTNDFLQDLRQFAVQKDAQKYQPTAGKLADVQGQMLKGETDYTKAKQTIDTFSRFATGEYLAELSYSNMKNGQVVSIPDTDGKMREYKVHELLDKRGFYAKILAPVNPGKDGTEPDIKVLFRGTHSNASNKKNFEKGGSAHETMERREDEFMQKVAVVVKGVVEEACKKNTNAKATITACGHSQGGACPEILVKHILSKIDKPAQEGPLSSISDAYISQVNLNVVGSAGVSKSNAKAITKLRQKTKGKLRKPSITSQLAEDDVVPGSGLHSAGFLTDDLANIETLEKKLHDPGIVQSHIRNPYLEPDKFKAMRVTKGHLARMNTLGLLGRGAALMAWDPAKSAKKLQERLRGGAEEQENVTLVRHDRKESDSTLSLTETGGASVSNPIGTVDMAGSTSTKDSGNDQRPLPQREARAARFNKAKADLRKQKTGSHSDLSASEGASPVVPSISKEEQARANIINELLKTELAYVQQMYEFSTLANDNFIDKLRTDYGATDEDIQVVRDGAAAAKEIYEGHSKILTGFHDLNELYNNGSDKTLEGKTQIESKYKEIAEIYSGLKEHYKKAFDCTEQILANQGANFHSAKPSQVKGDGSVSQNTVDAYFNLAFKRASLYPLLLNELSKVEDNPGLTLLSQKMKKLIDEKQAQSTLVATIDKYNDDKSTKAALKQRDLKLRLENFKLRTQIGELSKGANEDTDVIKATKSRIQQLENMLANDLAILEKESGSEISAAQKQAIENVKSAMQPKAKKRPLSQFTNPFGRRRSNSAGVGVSKRDSIIITSPYPEGSPQPTGAVADFEKKEQERLEQERQEQERQEQERQEQEQRGLARFTEITEDAQRRARGKHLSQHSPAKTFPPAQPSSDVTTLADDLRRYLTSDNEEKQLFKKIKQQLAPEGDLIQGRLDACLRVTEEELGKAPNNKSNRFQNIHGFIEQKEFRASIPDDEYIQRLLASVQTLINEKEKPEIDKIENAPVTPPPAPYEMTSGRGKGKPPKPVNPPPNWQRPTNVGEPTPVTARMDTKGQAQPAKSNKTRKPPASPLRPSSDTIPKNAAQEVAKQLAAAQAVAEPTQPKITKITPQKRQRKDGVIPPYHTDIQGGGRTVRTGDKTTLKMTGVAAIKEFAGDVKGKLDDTQKIKLEAAINALESSFEKYKKLKGSDNQARWQQFDDIHDKYEELRKVVYELNSEHTADLEKTVQIEILRLMGLEKDALINYNNMQEILAIQADTKSYIDTFAHNVHMAGDNNFVEVTKEQHELAKKGFDEVKEKLEQLQSDLKTKPVKDINKRMEAIFESAQKTRDHANIATYMQVRETSFGLTANRSGITPEATALNNDLLDILKNNSTNTGEFKQRVLGAKPEATHKAERTNGAVPPDVANLKGGRKTEGNTEKLTGLVAIRQFAFDLKTKLPQDKYEKLKGAVNSLKEAFDAYEKCTGNDEEKWKLYDVVRAQNDNLGMVARELGAKDTGQLKNSIDIMRELLRRQESQSNNRANSIARSMKNCSTIQKKVNEVGPKFEEISKGKGKLNNETYQIYTDLQGQLKDINEQHNKVQQLLGASPQNYEDITNAINELQAKSNKGIELLNDYTAVSKKALENGTPEYGTPTARREGKLRTFEPHKPRTPPPSTTAARDVGDAAIKAGGKSVVSQRRKIAPTEPEMQFLLKSDKRPELTSAQKLAKERAVQDKKAIPGSSAKKPAPHTRKGKLTKR